MSFYRHVVRPLLFRLSPDRSHAIGQFALRRRVPWREIRGKHVPQPGVLRVVEPDKRLGAGGILCLEAFVDPGEAVMVCRRAEPLVAQQRTDVGMPGDQPRL